MAIAFGFSIFTQLAANTIPNGIPSVENRVQLLYTHGVVGGRIDLHTFVDAASGLAEVSS